jgi:hypothetical protein
MRFQVTQEMIDVGKCGSASKCAIALALTEQLPLPPGYYYIVGGVDVDIVNRIGTTIQTIPLSESIAEFIENFDADRTSVSPRSFQI